MINTLVELKHKHLSLFGYKNRKAIYLILLYKHLSDKVVRGINEGYYISEENLLEAVVKKIKAGTFTKDNLEEIFFEIELSTKYTEAEAFFEDLYDPFIFERIDFEAVKKLICEIKDIETIDINEVIHYFAMNDQFQMEFSTTTSINKMIAKLVTHGIKECSVFDACCGVSSTLLSVGDYATVKKYVGQDIQQDQIWLSKIHMLMKDIPYDKVVLSCSNALKPNTDFINDKFEVQVCVSPMGLQWDGNEEILEDYRFGDYGIIPPKSDSTMLFIENVIAHMADNGRAAMIVNMNTLNAGSSIGKIREIIVNKNIIDAIIKLPEGAVYGTGISTYILLLAKNKTKQNIFYIDTTKYFKGRKILEITEDDINKVYELYVNRQNINDLCISATNKVIADNNYKLGIEQYLLRHKVERLLKKEKMVLLTDVAEVLKPKCKDKHTYGYVFDNGARVYPIDYSKLKEMPITDVVLQKGDIHFKRGAFRTMYLVDEEPKEVIYAEPLDIVIRPTNIQSEYLYAFLKSDIGKEIIHISSPSIKGFERVSVASIKEIEIPLPKKTAEEYRKIFEIENHLRIDISAFNTLIANKDKYIEESVEDILSSEYAANAKTYKQEVMQTFLTADINELNACFNAKAYKAAIILAGSILEAVLIDWLSEIKGEDYFEKDYIIIDRRTGREKSAELFDYINEIKYIERPRWMEEANKAHEIRKKRNLVHAKLCINSDEINETVCRQVINYLRDVLKTRGVQ